MMYFWLFLTVSLASAANLEKLIKSSPVVVAALKKINALEKNRGDDAPRSFVSVIDSKKEKLGADTVWKFSIKVSNTIQFATYAVTVLEKRKFTNDPYEVTNVEVA